MKKIINRSEDVVLEMCQGILAAGKDSLAFDRKSCFFTKKDLNADKVCLICGGGSGHEPAHAGFIGRGMLDAAVCGDVFASPSTMQIYNAIRRTQTPKGTLLIVKNYSGDVMNFDAAAEMARDDGILVESVYVDDDIAVEDSLYTVGRRGVAGTVFVHKIAGAAAELGKDLCEVKRIAEKTVRNVKTIGLALTSCTAPAMGKCTFDIAQDEIEFGVGIHGEPGIKRQKLQTADELAKKMCGMLAGELALESRCECAVIINGLGGTPLMELFILNNSATKYLDSHGITIYKTLVGNYMTSLDMAGVSITMLKLDEELKALLGCKADAMFFKN